MNAVEAPPRTDRNSVSDSLLDFVVQRTLPELQEMTPSPWWRGRKLWIILLTVLLIAAIAFTATLFPRSSAVPRVSIALPTGMIVSMQTLNGGDVAVRTPTDNIVYVPLMGKQVLTQDQQPLAITSMRVGDTVTIRSEKVVVDSSQVLASVAGIVASAPGPDSDVMTVQVTPTRMILVDMGPRTRINGGEPSVTTRMSVMDVDQIRVVGILNTTLDEMTQAETIDTVDG